MRPRIALTLAPTSYCAPLDPVFEIRHRSDARNSFDGLYRQSAADLPVSRPALASVAIPVATTTFQCPSPARSEFCALDSWLRHCSSRDVAHSDRNRDLGATATCRVVELDSPAGMGRSDRDVPFNGLRLLVVALGHASAIFRDFTAYITPTWISM